MICRTAFDHFTAEQVASSRRPCRGDGPHSERMRNSHVIFFFFSARSRQLEAVASERRRHHLPERGRGERHAGAARMIEPRCLRSSRHCPRSLTAAVGRSAAPDALDTGVGTGDGTAATALVVAGIGFFALLVLVYVLQALRRTAIESDRTSCVSCGQALRHYKSMSLFFEARTPALGARMT